MEESRRKEAANAGKLVILTGPTAVGKTALSVALAKKIGGEIISADSMQVYRGMDSGSAKVTVEEMQGIPLGGTGFYIQSVLYDIDFTENGSDHSYREELETLVKEHGAEYLHTMLALVDPASAEAIHANNVKRVIRALEFYRETGERISEHNEEERRKASPYQFAYFVLNDARDRIYANIDCRVDLMLEHGLVEEVRRLQAQGCTRDMVSMQGLGYKEILDYLDGRCSYEEAVRVLKRDTRHFAKRQLTWFRRERDVIWVNKQEIGYEPEQLLAYMLPELAKRGI